MKPAPETPVCSHTIAPATVLRGERAWREALPAVSSLLRHPSRRYPAPFVSFPSESRPPEQNSERSCLDESFLLLPPPLASSSPARLGSTRFPGKALADRTGRPLVAHVHERASAASTVDEVLVATDDERIADRIAAERFRAVGVTLPEDQRSARAARSWRRVRTRWS